MKGVCCGEKMREGGENLWRMREEEWGNNKTSKIFKFQIMRESFTRSTYIGEERELLNP